MSAVPGKSGAVSPLQLSPQRRRIDRPSSQEVGGLPGCNHRSAQLDLDLILGKPLKDLVELGSQMAMSHLGVVPGQAERPLGAPPARHTVVERVTVPAEIAARAVDGLADGAVEAFDVGDVAPVELVGAVGWLVRRLGRW